eukprot:TRINITY_DN2112_c0_g1_i3.p2 TRINITY_DN2112_c0_g1~~TRINITY_DN2112_c0_g1_i3.p2  ORF type:complete len:179 (+),score=29.23 TRINITY_DN2112_c0_g1_i3:115-651(+)
MIRRPPRSTLSSSSAASDVYKRQVSTQSTGAFVEMALWLCLCAAMAVASAALLEDSWAEDDIWAEAVGSVGYVSTRTRIGCNACASKPSCASWVPPVSLFNATRPALERNLGSLAECKPSQAEIWRTSGSFKVGDDQHLPKETRPGCPAENRRPKYQGNLDTARRICNLCRCPNAKCN